MPNDKKRPDETDDDFLGRLIDQELERHGLSAPAPTPEPETDSLEKIHADFPDLFGKPKTGG